MSESWNIEWLNQNALRAFPFKEDAAKVDEAGLIAIPDRILVDLIFVVPADVAAIFHLRTLTIAGPHLTMVFSDDSGNTFSSLTVDLGTHQTNDAYDLLGTGEFRDARGKVVIGDLTNLSADIPDGLYTFSVTATSLESRTVRPDLRQVRSLQLVRADGTTSEELTGIIRLIEGTNARLTFVPAVIDLVPDPITGTPVPTVTTPAGVRFDCIGGDPFDQECECEQSFPLPDCIRSINGVTGDENGNLLLESADLCLTLSDSGNVITFEDKCARPCCGCAELDFVVDTLNTLQSSVEILDGRAGELQTQQQNFQNNVLGSLT
jgi:hypothetical protein